MATMTIAHARRTLGRLIGPWIALADVDYALAESARLRGLSPAATTRLSDADVLTLEVDDFDPFIKVASLRCWEMIFGNATESGLRDIGLDDNPREVREAAKAAIKGLKDYVKDVYGVGLAAISVGVIGLDFQAGADDETSSGDF